MFRDVFLLVNDAIRSFPCRVLQSIPYLTFDLHEHSTQFTNEKFTELLYYLKSMTDPFDLYSTTVPCIDMNVLSKTYTDWLPQINDALDQNLLVSLMRMFNRIDCSL